jgi:N-acetyl-alpha-D-glucosaminyl L-malate synthase BshA
MRIAFLTLLFPPRWVGGIEIATYNLAVELSKRGHEVHVVTSLDEGVPAESVEQGVHIHRLPYPSRVPFWSVMTFFQRASRCMKGIRPDLVQIQSLLWGWMGSSMRFTRGTPFIVAGHGDDVYRDSRLKMPAIRSSLRRADAVIALTPNMERELERIYDRDIHVVPNGIHVGWFSRPDPEARSRWGLSDESKVIVYIGGLRPVKGVEHLVRAFRSIKASVPDATLLLVGDGQERAALEGLTDRSDLSGSVRFVGEVKNEEVPAYLSASDVFVLPSLSEGLPIVALEAMAAGLPVVCSRVGGLPDLIGEGENGFLVVPGDEQGIASSVVRLLTDEALRSRISANNRKKAQDYDWGVIASQAEGIYEDVLRKRGNVAAHRLKVVEGGDAKS